MNIASLPLAAFSNFCIKLNVIIPADAADIDISTFMEFRAAERAKLWGEDKMLVVRRIEMHHYPFAIKLQNYFIYLPLKHAPRYERKEIPRIITLIMFPFTR